MKKICFLSGYFNRFDLLSKSQGGAEYQNFLLKNALEERNFKIYFISIGDRNEIFRDGETIVIYIKKKIKTRKLGDNFFLYLPYVYKILKKINPDYIYQRVSHSWTLVASIYSKINCKKFIWAAASEEDVKPFKMDKISNLIFNYIDFTLSKYGKKKADTIFVQAKYQENLLAKHYKLYANEIIKNFHPLPIKDSVKDNSEFLIIWIANFSHNKQPDKFIDIARVFNENNLPIRFIMIGRPFSTKDQKKISNELNSLSNISYLGPLRQEELNLILAKSHILINTSIIEGFSNVFIQAWLRGTVVFSLNSNPDNIIDEEGIGYFANGNLNKIIQEIENLYKNRTSWELLSNRCIEYSKENYSIESQIYKILPYFK